eukprot:NODE_159_length_2317_cov_91.151675_g113_i0.p1 GENE.NODE_159_length_2317_cov_91.151675_g113_i0~~NODE_159_length_2317_cov_91.151675_g113_i0.p1  ORF type:complete len:752 (-),score=174.38 NODE_159_length_2317_cov_91.151675_g113_i0:3-2258(-)
MRINVTQSPAPQHTDTCTAVGWSYSGELFSCSDDSTIMKWNMNGEPISKVCELDTCCTAIKWFPNISNQKNSTDLFVVACSDGTFKIINPVTGRTEKSVEAHKGAVVCLAWNWDGTALVTGGEEGVVKTWSQSGQLRTTLASNAQTIHSLSWGPESDQVLYTCGKDLIIKPLQPSSKQLQWKAHDGVVLQVDWSPVTNMIVSGAEDGRYKVWDSYGRQLFQSQPLDYAITAVEFSPDGEMYAVGSFNMLRVCDKTGWSQCRENTATGSIFNIAWTADCTQLACAGGNGSVCFAQLVDRRIEYKNLIIILAEANKVSVRDVVTDHLEDLEHRDKIIKMSVGYGFLIVATSTQCCIYDVTNWNAPTMFDVKDAVNLICQADKLFLIMDHSNGVQLFQYDGRAVSTLKMSGIRTEFLNYQSVNLSPDTVVVKDAFEPKAIKVFEALTGRLAPGIVINHNMEIVEICLNQFGPQSERKCAIIDRNRDLYLTSVAAKSQPYKLATMVASVKWNDYSEILVAIADGKLVVWYYPSVVYIDRDLLPKTRIIRTDAEFGRHDQLLDFFGSRCSCRRGSDGAVLTFAIRPYPIMLFTHVGNNAWDTAVRLCRFVKEPALWSILAALAVKGGELNTAEEAYANIDESDKLQYIKYISEIPNAAGRSAELQLFQRRQDEAETILLQAGLIYRAIKLNIRLFNFERALHLAVQHKTHIDTVLYFRQKYLNNFHKEEQSENFLKEEIKAVCYVCVLTHSPCTLR